jgi:glycosyltransferase involved in cell wall biosynthesis
VYVLTSAREGIPLTLLEAMAVGTPAVVPHVGSVTDAVSHGENGLVVGEADPEAVADAIERLLEDNALRERLASNAPGVRDSFSYDAARDDWRAILMSLRDPGPATA